MIDKTQFDKLTPAQKRVEIAKDVIARVGLGKLVAKSGSLFRTAAGNAFLPQGADPQEYLNNKECRVCGKGALVCSWVSNFNNIGRSAFDALSYQLYTWNDNDSISELRELFGDDMLNLIEIAFEGEVFRWSGKYAIKAEALRGTCNICIDDTKDAKLYFGNLTAIMQNIVDNDGEFVFDPFSE